MTRTRSRSLTVSPARCVLLFARSPREEAAAKRLRGAESFFASLLRRTAAEAASLHGVDLLVAGDPRGALPRGAQRIGQDGATFAERLEGAVAEARRRGYSEIVVIGSDTPGIRAADLSAAFGLLARHRLVIGPSADGGVFLIGLRADASAALEGIPWCTPKVFRELLRAGPDAAVIAAIRPDVDGIDDLRALLWTGRLARPLARLAAAAVRGAHGRASPVFPPITSRLTASIEAPRPPPACFSA